MKKKILSILLLSLTLVFCFTSCDGQKALENFDDDCLHIVNATSLKLFRDMVNSGTTFEGKVVVLDRDIDLSKDTDPWVPIGTTSRAFDDKTDDGIKAFLNTRHVFKGNFDGKGHTIRVHVDVNPTDENFVGGVFGIVGGRGSIRNLVVDGLVKNEAIKNSTAAGIVGGIYTLKGETYSIRNCVNKANVQANVNGVREQTKGSAAAGIVGRAYGCGKIEVLECINYGNIECGNKAGGIVGSTTNTLTKYTISSCINDGRVSGGTAAGGIVALAWGGNSDKTNDPMMSITKNRNFGIVERKRQYTNADWAEAKGSKYSDEIYIQEFAIDEPKGDDWWGYIGEIIGEASPTTMMTSPNGSSVWDMKWKDFRHYFDEKQNGDNGLVRVYSKQGTFEKEF